MTQQNQILFVNKRNNNNNNGLLTRGFELVTRGFELVTPRLNS